MLVALLSRSFVCAQGPRDLLLVPQDYPFPVLLAVLGVGAPFVTVSLCALLLSCHSVYLELFSSCLSVQSSLGGAVLLVDII